MRLRDIQLSDSIMSFVQYRDMNPRFPSSDNRRMFLGITFMVVGLILPVGIQPQISRLLVDLHQSIVLSDAGLLLLASNKLVFLNTLRHSPIIIGAFLFGEGLVSRFRLNRLFFFFSLMLIPLIFRIISIVYRFEFLFSRSTLITVIVILLLYFITYRVRTIPIKVIIIFLFLSGFDWLEIVPLFHKLGFGHRDVASSIRVISKYLNADYIMNYVGLAFSSMLIINALVLTKVVVDHYKRMSLVDKLRKIEIQALHSRSFQEIKHLVHDLKTPLVTIQGLNEVIGLKVDDEQVKSYTERISNSVEKVSFMITEILHERTLRPVHVGEITDFLKVHLSLEELQSRVRIHSYTDAMILANKHLMARALINIIDNGLQACDKLDGRVDVQALKENGEVVFKISDNGKGIPRELLDKIWELGYTKGKSTGLGLNFVKKVVDDHHGKIRIRSQVGVGTTVTISLPGVKANNETDSSS